MFVEAFGNISETWLSQAEGVELALPFVGSVELPEPLQPRLCNGRQVYTVGSGTHVSFGSPTSSESGSWMTSDGNDEEITC